MSSSNDNKKKPGAEVAEFESLNIEELDIHELERRLELAQLSVAADCYGNNDCGTDCKCNGAYSSCTCFGDCGLV